MLDIKSTCTQMTNKTNITDLLLGQQGVNKFFTNPLEKMLFPTKNGSETEPASPQALIFCNTKPNTINKSQHVYYKIALSYVAYDVSYRLELLTIP